MAYIGSVPANQTTGARPRDEYVADGVQATFPLTQGVPGNYETNALVVVNNVIQRPVDAFTIIDTYQIRFSSGTGTYVLNETVTGDTSSATGKVIQVNAGSIVVERLTGTFQNETYTGGTSGAVKVASSVTFLAGQGLKFVSAPASSSAIYVIHQGQATYSMVPAAGSVGATQLDPNLRTFTLDQFVGNGSNTQYSLSDTPYSINSIIVISDGIVQTKISNFSLSGNVLTFTSAPDLNADIQVLHLGFSNGVKSVPDRSITPVKLSNGGPTWDTNYVLTVGSNTNVSGATNPVIAINGSANSYLQAYVVNKNAGSGASADLCVYPDNGTDAAGWIDMGITSSTFANGTFSVTGANEGYLFMSAPSGASKTGNMVYATDSTGSNNAHQWYVGGFNALKTATKMQLDTSGLNLAGHFLPRASSTYDLGSTTNSWRHVYTGDLHLSNEQHDTGNVVDGTKGNWTIQEGAEDLYLVNNKTGRKYKFNLTEVN